MHAVCDSGQTDVFKWQFAVEAFRDATSQPHCYLLIDLKSDTDERYRLRKNIFPDQQTYVYVSKR